VSPERSDYRADPRPARGIPSARPLARRVVCKTATTGIHVRVFSPPHRRTSESFAIWSAARAEANLALDAWRASPGRDAYMVYRAAEDRADAAEAALWGLSAPLGRVA
jgi:hypothetical protein